MLMEDDPREDEEDSLNIWNIRLLWPTDKTPRNRIFSPKFYLNNY